MGILSDIILSEYLENKREKQAQQLEGLLGQRYEPGSGQGMLENTGLLGGQFGPEEFAARMMAIPGYAGAGERIFSGLAQRRMQNQTDLARQEMALNTMTPYDQARLKIQDQQNKWQRYYQGAKDAFGFEDKIAGDYATAIKPYQTVLDAQQEITDMYNQMTQGGKEMLPPWGQIALVRRAFRRISNEAFMSDDREAIEAQRSLQQAAEQLLKKAEQGGTVLQTEIDQIREMMSSLAVHAGRRKEQINEQARGRAQRWGVNPPWNQTGAFQYPGRPSGTSGGFGQAPPPGSAPGSSGTFQQFDQSKPMTVDEFQYLQNQQQKEDSGSIWNFWNN